MVVIAEGTLLLFVEGRVNSRRDKGDSVVQLASCRFLGS